MGAFLGAQQFLEPGMRYVLEGKYQRQSAADQEKLKEWLLARLLACLDTDPVDCEEVRFLLGTARKAGFDWRELYENAVSMRLSLRPEDAGRFPGPEEVAPQE